MNGGTSCRTHNVPGVHGGVHDTYFGDTSVTDDTNAVTAVNGSTMHETPLSTGFRAHLARQG
jgi:hypothetical protein